MGFHYPHTEAELLLGIAGVAIVFCLIVPILKYLPQWAAIPVAALPLVLLFAVFGWVWYRRKYG